MSGVPVTSIAVDGSGDIYVAGFTSVSELAPRTHRVIRTLTGFSQINDIALDEKGNLYVVDLGFYDVGDGMLLGSNLQLFPPGATTPSRVFVDQGNGAQGPYLAVAVDRAGNAYVTVSNAEIEVFTPGQTGTDGTPRLIPGTENASAIACDSLGNLYVYSAALTKFLVPSAGSIAVFAPGGSSPIRTISVGVGFPESVKALALSSANQLFVASGSIVVADGRPAVNQYAAGSSAPVQSFGPLTNPTAVALDALGNLYVVDLKTATVSNIVEFSPGGKLTRTLPLATSAIGIDDEP